MPSKAKLTWDSALYQVDALKIRDSKELRAEYTRLRDITQKRLKRLAASEFAEGSTYRHYKDMFPKLAEIKSDAELRKRLSEAARFVEAKTTTVSGIKAKRKAQIKSLQEQGYDWVDEDNFEQFVEWIDDYVAKHSNKNYYPAPEQIKEAYKEEFGKIDSDELKKEFEASKKQKKPRERRRKDSSAAVEKKISSGRQKQPSKRRRR